MLSGTFLTSQVVYSGNPDITTKFRLDWEATQSQSGNYSDVDWTLTTVQTPTGSGYKRTVYKAYVTVNGITTSSSSQIQVSNGVVVLSGTTRVTHNADGTKTIVIQAGVAVGSNPYNCTGLKSFVLDPIPRGSTISCASEAIMGNTITITITQSDEDYSHILYAIVGNLTNEIGRDQGSATYSWTLPDTAASVTDADGTNYVLQCVTYHDNDYTGEEVTSKKTVYAQVPIEYVPIISIGTIGNNNVPAGFPFVVGYSKLSIPTTIAGSHGSTIVNRSVQVGNEVLNSQETGTITLTMVSAIQTTSVLVTVTAIDSRGRTATATTTINAEPYSSPQISIDCTRCDNDGTVNPAGEHLAVKAVWKYSSIDDNNSADIGVYVDGTLETTYTTLNNNQPVLLEIARISDIYASDQYAITAIITDALASTAITATVAKAIIPLSPYDDGNDIGVTFGQMSVAPGFRLTKKMFDDGNLHEFVDYKTKVLWENSSPTSSFAAQNITLNSDEYDFYEIIFNQVTSVDYYMSSGIIPKGHGTRLTAMFVANGGVGGRTRIVDYADDTTLAVQVGRLVSTGQTTITNDNSACIPIAVLGYRR